MTARFHRLNGPPGTGKTRALATVWAPRAVEKFGGDAVAICSLTRTAASEIRSRVEGIPTENVGTLHALAYRALGRPTIAESKIHEWNERRPDLALRPSVRSLDRSAENGGPGADQEFGGEQAAARAGICRHRRKPRDAWPADALAFQVAWEDWMSSGGYTDFTGLIERAHVEVPTAPGRPECLVVDEAQDSSRLEMDLVRAWGADADHVVLAGDGDQAIYGFRGADPEAFADMDGDDRHLRQSFRVPARVLELAEKWIGRASRRFAESYKPRTVTPENGTDVGSVWRGASSNALDLIHGELDKGRSAMLIAPCEYMLRRYVKELRDLGEPFHNPYRPENGAWNPLAKVAGRIFSFLAPATSGKMVPWTWAQMRRFVDIMDARAGVLARGAKAEVEKARKDGRAPLVYWPELVKSEIFTEQGADDCFDVLSAASRGNHVKAVEWLFSKVLVSRKRLLEFPLKVLRNRGLEALRDRPRITVGTIHSVKGGESDSVFVVPDLSPAYWRAWQGQNGTSERDAVVRMFYVALTRARESVFVLSPRERFRVAI